MADKRMRRLMVEPMNWGTQSGNAWGGDVGGGTPPPLIQPHIDYVEQYTLDHSIRIWEPGRLSLSEPALFQMAPGYQGQTPAGSGLTVVPEAIGVTIHGIKGDIFLGMAGRSFTAGSGFPTVLGEFTDPESDLPYTVTEESAWRALGGANDIGTGTKVRSGPLFMPVFICMYRGTYKQLDDNTGWEIDSGPADDPDTLLGLDISAPSVLEDPRMDWWCQVEVPFPSYQFDKLDDLTEEYTFLAARPTRPMIRVPMNLEQNKRLGPNQVLWLHVRTGVIRCWVLADTHGFVNANYRNHDMLFSSKMSMLVTPHG